MGGPGAGGAGVIWVALGVIVVLLTVSGVITAAETAVFSVTSTRLRTLLDEGFEGAPELVRLRDQPASLRGAIHVVVTLLSFTALGVAILTGSRLGRPGLALAISLPAVLFFSEILPRALAARRSVGLALSAAPVLVSLIRRLSFVFAPFMRLEDLLSGRDNQEDDEEREVREIARLGREAGIIGLEEHALVERAFKLDELTAFEVMTPRVDMFCWRDSDRLGDLVETFPDVPHSRVPVYGESVDDITGIVYVREAYEQWVSGNRDVTLGSLARAPFFVPGSMSLAQLMRDFQGRRIHMGIVADEYGGTDGLVTLEDVLEELVGEIVDETDMEEDELQQVAHDEWVADGGVDLRDVEETFQAQFPEAEHRTLNGFLLEEFGYVPEAGESMETGGVVMEVLEASDTQVVRVRIRPGQESPAPEDD